MKIKNNLIDNKTFVYHLANTFRGSEFLCKIILFLFVHNIHKATAVISDTTLNPTVRKYYADLLVNRELVNITHRGYTKDGGFMFPKGLLEKIQNIASTITSSGNTLIKDWLIEDYELYLDKRADYMWHEKKRARSRIYDIMYSYTDSYPPQENILSKAVKEHMDKTRENYPKYRPNIVLRNVLRYKGFLKTLANDDSLDKGIRDALSK